MPQRVGREAWNEGVVDMDDVEAARAEQSLDPVAHVDRDRGLPPAAAGDLHPAAHRKHPGLLAGGEESVGIVTQACQGRLGLGNAAATPGGSRDQHRMTAPGQLFADPARVLVYSSPFREWERGELNY